MIDQKALESFIEKELEGTDKFLVGLRVSKDNDIEVTIDSDSPLSVEDCEVLTRAIESEFDRDKEDYTLEVGSAGLTSPLKVPRQYKKHIGDELEVIDTSGKKHVGTLKEATDEGIILICPEKVKKEGMKRPVIEDVERSFPYKEIKQTKYLLKF